MENNLDIRFLDSPASTDSGIVSAPDFQEMELLDAYSKVVTRAVYEVSSRVVNVHMRKTTSIRPGTSFRGSEGTASGVIIAPDGYPALENTGDQ